MKNKLKFSALLVSSCLVNSQANAVDIDLTIVGKGTVNVAENSVECKESCTINNNDQVNTLVPSVQDSGKFLGWTGQQCDSGNQVVVEQNFNLIHKAPSGAKTLSAADIDNDGKLDLAAISLFNGQVQILKNQGDASFNATSLASGLRYPTAMDFFDWDNDGDQDLLVAEYTSKLIKVYLNDGNGDFSHQNDISLGGAAVYAIAIEDLNEDGLPDLVVSSFSANISGNLQTLVDSIRQGETRWYLNNGNDDFTASTVLSNTAAITLDVHKNQSLGSIDVVAAEIEDGDIAVYRLNNSTVTRELVANGRGAYGAAFSDIDNNGHMDVLSTHYEPSVAKLTYGYEGGSFSGETDIMTFKEGVTATAFIDVNEDGYLDALVSEFNSNDFGYIETISYKDCVVSSSAATSVTANFSEETTPEVSPTPPSPKAKDSGSSGGSFGYALFALLLLSRLRSKR
ncbi:VCBS repeat-containing protein [Psychrobium sp. 1_MG-2023]|uniref:FG-GAP repeat domain-containing protein n=1 Tax=Psychrobium sp. 1_MG-2023 TaxID=3062624 RepID=UPI000C338B4B|nr:VCBS repeat-containing protein [Psychrobium sp. 1_MG-2023]MDP2561373.1 VCBS repeat-containing protein [Psychrobium sp. 1_MG-2023]PKF54854.1 VCBS repeat-containing protein [Alteromonadales bacterium alter-6D02]